MLRTATHKSNQNQMPLIFLVLFSRSLSRGLFRLSSTDSEAPPVLRFLSFCWARGQTDVCIGCVNSLKKPDLCQIILTCSSSHQVLKDHSERVLFPPEDFCGWVEARSASSTENAKAFTMHSMSTTEKGNEKRRHFARFLCSNPSLKSAHDTQTNCCLELT